MFSRTGAWGVWDSITRVCELVASVDGIALRGNMHGYGSGKDMKKGHCGTNEIIILLDDLTCHRLS